jgi:hypothetical protein
MIGARRSRLRVAADVAAPVMRRSGLFEARLALLGHGDDTGVCHTRAQR